MELSSEEILDIERETKKLRKYISKFYKRWWDGENIPDNNKVYDYYIHLRELRNLEWALETGTYEDDIGGLAMVTAFLYD